MFCCNLATIVICFFENIFRGSLKPHGKLLRVCDKINIRVNLDFFLILSRPSQLTHILLLMKSDGLTDGQTDELDNTDHSMT